MEIFSTGSHFHSLSCGCSYQACHVLQWLVQSWHLLLPISVWFGGSKLALLYTVHLFQRISPPFPEIHTILGTPKYSHLVELCLQFCALFTFWKEQAHLLQSTKRLIVFPMVPKTPVIKVATPESQNFHSLSRMVGESVIVFIFVFVFLFFHALSPHQSDQLSTVT